MLQPLNTAHQGKGDTAALRVGAGELMAMVQTAMLAGLPYTALRDSILAQGRTGVCMDSSSIGSLWNCTPAADPADTRLSSVPSVVQWCRCLTFPVQLLQENSLVRKPSFLNFQEKTHDSHRPQSQFILAFPHR